MMLYTDYVDKSTEKDHFMCAQTHVKCRGPSTERQSPAESNEK